MPDPNRQAPRGVETPWRTFTKIHMNVIVACDYLCKTVLTLVGKLSGFFANIHPPA